MEEPGSQIRRFNPCCQEREISPDEGATWEAVKNG